MPTGRSNRTRFRETHVTSEQIIWRGKDEIPQAAGWYRVKRDGDQKVRAWGQGHWWIAIPNGWLSADGVYEWTCPVSVDGFPSSDLGLSFTSLDLTLQGGLMPQASEAPDSYSTPPCGDADVRARS